MAPLIWVCRGGWEELWGKAPHMGPYLPNSEFVCPQYDVWYGMGQLRSGGSVALNELH